MVISSASGEQQVDPRLVGVQDTFLLGSASIQIFVPGLTRLLRGFASKWMLSAGWSKNSWSIDDYTGLGKCGHRAACVITSLGFRPWSPPWLSGEAVEVSPDGQIIPVSRGH